MSSMPPISPRLAPAAPQTANAAAVRDARAMFFKAMGEVPAAAPSSPVIPPAALRQAIPTPAAAPAASPPGAEDARFRRPGSLLNILV
jgi:type II secretory pathway component HofQ